MIKKCVNCGKEFTPYPGAELIQKYCSEHCKREFNYKKQKLRDMRMNQPNDTAPPVLKTATCLHCRGEFKQTFPNEKFCSDECRLEYFQASPLQPHLLRRRSHDL